MKNLNVRKHHVPRRLVLMTVATALVAALAVAVPQAAEADAVTPPPVPGGLDAPDGNVAYLVGRAYGTQNYICLLGESGFTWTFFGPQATVFTDDGAQSMTHFLSPNPVENGALRATWQHSVDTSAAWAVAIANSSDPSFVAPGAIPWLLLRVVGAQYGPSWGGTLTTTTFIQRVNTVGGIAPAIGCGRAADIGRKAMVPYTADYIFYKITP